MEFSKLKLNVIETEKKYRKEFEEISDVIFNNPELSGEEHWSSKYLAGVMSSHGFKVEFPYPDMETAFTAEYGDEDGPVIAFLAEYDALPGYETPSGNGHACGHNWIASTMAGCAIVLSKLKENFKGKILLIGTPAEETYGAKVDMVKKGTFDNVDVIFQSHLESETVIDTAALAMSSIQFEFTGRASHAASFPEEGINALDAVQLTFMGINSLRQHVKPDVRIHGIITDGGLATNIVPARGVCQITMRSSDKKYLEHVVSRVIDCAKGAAMITGAGVKYHNFENTFDDLLNIPYLMEIMKKNLIEAGITKFSSQEDAPPPGSTDIGNVSYVCPTMYLEVDVEADRPMKSHEAEALDYVNSEYSYRKMTQIINATVCSALELYLDKDKLEKVKEEHKSLI
ncbi:MAG: M20 family metallopeptidase [Proteocatella sp.]